MKVEEKYRSKLFVEGNDDQHVIWSLCQSNNIKESFDIVDCGSFEKVINTFDLYLNEQSSTVDIIGIVVDADTDLSSCWSRIKDKIEKTGKYSLNNNLPKEGLILNSDISGSPRIGIWVMPDNNTNGMLEDFVAMLADKDDALMNRSDIVLKSLEDDKIQKYKAVHKPKAKIHTYLAWQDEPGKPMGQAITAKILNPKSPKAKHFVDWLTTLFNC